MTVTKKPTSSRRASSLSATSSPTFHASATGQDATEGAGIKIIVGRSIEDAGAAFLDAWGRAERGETVRQRILSFEDWEGLAAVLTGERYRLLRHLHGHPAPSVSALTKAHGRQYRRVHADVAALESAGLLDRSQGQVRTTADRINVDIRL